MSGKLSSVTKDMMPDHKEKFETFREATVRKHELEQGREEKIVYPIVEQGGFYVVSWSDE